MKKQLVHERSEIEIMRDIIIAKRSQGVSLADRNYYGGKLREMLSADKSKRNVYMIDKNPNVRLAAKVIFQDKEEKL